MDETILLQDQNITVTNVRLSVSGQTFPIKSITSVRSSQQNPSRIPPIIMGLVALFAFIDGSNTVVVLGILLIAGAVALWFLQKPELKVLVGTSTGEATILHSRESEQITKLVSAIQKAIVSYG
jgi:Family of unknown function (DUF6232)